jgi:outer membrane scaffolding protein for murein synthesis (MipA/OmpV family)
MIAMTLNTILRLLLVFLLLYPQLNLAEEKPLWEAGIGVGGMSFPAYRGSDKRHNFLLPVPYFVYHGDFLKADRHGIRGSLFDSDFVDLTLSFSASPPTNSDDIEAREGMPDLKTTFEFGPQVDFTLWRNMNQTRSLRLRVPARAAFTVERSAESIGWIFSPRLNLDITDLPAMPGWNLGFVAGPIYATEDQHDYFYGVEQQYTTSERPAYQTTGGYSGSQFLFTLSKRFERTWVGAFIRYDTLSNAVFEDSPLVTEDSFAAAGIAISWVLSESKTMVNVDHY